MNNVDSKYITNLSVQNVDPYRYLVESRGEIYDTLNNRYLCHIIDNEGYHRVSIHTTSGFKSKYLHRIVKIEFDGFDPDESKNQIDHKDCDKSHNYVSNLEWVTKAENALRAIKNNLYYQFDVKLSDDDVEMICKLLKEGKSYKYIADILFPKYNQNTIGMIGKIYRGERWKHISIKYIPFPELEKSDNVFVNTLPDHVVIAICEYLLIEEDIEVINKYIKERFNIDADLKYTIDGIRRGIKYREISKEYALLIKEDNMPKTQNQQNNNIDFEESIKNYGSKIEHIDSFVEAVRKFPGKPSTAWHIRNGVKIILF